MTSRFTIVMEYENAGTHEQAGAAPVFVALLRQFSGRPARRAHDRDELILVFDPDDENEDDIARIIRESAPDLYDHVDIRTLPCRGMRYYDFKNAGAKIARGDILVFLDSDSVPEVDWLDALLTPFANPGVVAVNGQTYLGHSDFLSRVFALVWIFPLRDDSPHEIARRSLNANNCAFRRDWFASHNFPYHHGFKVSCSLLAARMRSEGVELLRVPALARHKPLEGWRFVLWRAAITGRDDDGRFVTMRSAARTARLVRAFTRWLNSSLRSVRRIVGRHRSVGMPAYQIPAAIAAAWIYFAAAFGSQVVSALSKPRTEPERIPRFVLSRW